MAPGNTNFSIFMIAVDDPPVQERAIVRPIATNPIYSFRNNSLEAGVSVRFMAVGQMPPNVRPAGRPKAYSTLAGYLLLSRRFRLHLLRVPAACTPLEI